MTVEIVLYLLNLYILINLLYQILKLHLINNRYLIYLFYNKCQNKANKLKYKSINEVDAIKFRPIKKWKQLRNIIINKHNKENIFNILNN